MGWMQKEINKSKSGKMRNELRHEIRHPAKREQQPEVKRGLF